MSAYRIDARRPRTLEPRPRGAAVGLSIAAGAAGLIAAASAVASAVAWGAGSGALLVTPAWSATSIAASLVLCGGLTVAGVSGADRGQRRTALLAATLWLVATVAPWVDPSHAHGHWGNGCELGAAATTGHAGNSSAPLLFFLLFFGLRSAAWIAVCAVPLVWLRPYARSALPAVAAAAIGLVTIAASWRSELAHDAGTTLSFAALAFAAATVLRAQRSPSLAEAAVSVRLDAADRASDATAYDAFASGRLREVMYAVVVCTIGFALESGSFGIVATGMTGTALTSLALLVTVERVRRSTTPRTSLVPVLAAATSLASTIGVALAPRISGQHFLRDAAVLAFAVALLGLVLALPPPAAARRVEARQLMFMIGALALTMLVSAMLGLVSGPQHEAYILRALRTVVVSVLDGAALALAFTAAHRAASLEVHARTRIAARALE